MILGQNGILEAYEKGFIDIDPFDKKKLNPNSYNLSLSDDLATYKPSFVDKKHQIRYGIDFVTKEKSNVLDMKKKNELELFKIPKEGYELKPGTLYLGRTVERTKTVGYIPMLEGRSSIGRLGLFIHVTAGFGDNGFEGFWTLELSCVQPIRIYSGIEICQIYYHTTEPGNGLYSGKYQNNKGIQPSMIWKELQ